MTGGATAELAIHGTASGTLGALTSASTGALAIAGQADATLGALTATATATIVGATPTFGAAGTLFATAGAIDNLGGPHSYNIAYPASVGANDILICTVYYDDPNISTDPGVSFTPPAGWATLTGPTDNLGGTSQTFWKRAAGGESGTVVFQMTGGFTAGNRIFYATMTRWVGCLTSGTPYEAAGSNTGAGTAITGTGVTTTGTNRRVVSVNVIQEDEVSAPDTGWTEDNEQTSTVSGDGCIVWSSIEKVAAGAQGAESRTIATSQRWINHAFALLPT